MATLASLHTLEWTVAAPSFNLARLDSAGEPCASKRSLYESGGNQLRGKHTVLIKRDCIRLIIDDHSQDLSVNRQTCKMMLLQVISLFEKVQIIEIIPFRPTSTNKVISNGISGQLECPLDSSLAIAAPMKRIKTIPSSTSIPPELFSTSYSP